MEIAETHRKVHNELEENVSVVCYLCSISSVLVWSTPSHDHMRFLRRFLFRTCNLDNLFTHSSYFGGSEMVTTIAERMFDKSGSATESHAAAGAEMVQIPNMQSNVTSLIAGKQPEK